jgi:hypothetical protein
MNNPPKQQYEDWMTEDDIAEYDMLVALGRNQLGKELGGDEEYLLHLSAVITLKQKRGLCLEMDDPTIVRLKQVHKNFQEAGLIFETPPNDWYYSPENPINQPPIPHDELKPPEKTDTDKNEVIDETLKKDWVKLIQPACDENECLSCGS